MPTTGTFELDSVLFEKDPLTKTWQRQAQAIGGEGESIFAELWSLTMNFGTLHVTGMSGFLMGKFKEDTLHDAKLPHPTTAILTSFTGVAIESYSFSFTNVDRATWAFNPTLVLSGIAVT